MLIIQGNNHTHYKTQEIIFCYICPFYRFRPNKHRQTQTQTKYTMKDNYNNPWEAMGINSGIQQCSGISAFILARAKY